MDAKLRRALSALLLLALLVALARRVASAAAPLHWPQPHYVWMEQ